MSESEVSDEEYTDISSSDEDLLYSEIAGYRFEPELTEEEILQRRMERLSQPECSQQPPPAQGQRINNTDWCACGKCLGMPTEYECLCCRESDKICKILAEYEMPSGSSVSHSTQNCFTQHPDFEAHINKGVLTTFFRTNRINWKKFPKPKGPNGTLTNTQLRLVAYRHILEWILQGEKLGLHNRMPLPSCVIRVVRALYPSETEEYVGFQWHN